MTLLHIRDHGGDGPELVLLHGAGRSHADWDAVAGELTAGHRVLALDLPGHGRSPDLSPWTMPAAVRGIAGTLAAHGVTAPVMVGTSLGGLAAVEYARAHDDVVRAAVNLDGFWWGRPGEYPGAERVGELLRAATGVVAPPEYIEDEVAHAARYGIPADRAEAAARAAARPIPGGGWQTLPERPAAQQMFDELDRLGALGVTSWLAGVTRPLLLVQAGRPHGPMPVAGWFAELAERFARGLAAELAELARVRPTISVARVEAGHAMVLETPEAVATLIAGFVRDLPA
ncbi:alpha/beta fold hydrolase [Streptomyces sp. WZ-12]|uniref:alpha/beta fold hydrolase n=1 Tax=Streptomyces sp. WZ-12 TaxID=3030210 RepID=UPI0023815B35|nr:alpha/beta hydrolase [Streptomyces sp. WZ-12]